MKNILVTLRPYATQIGRISVPNGMEGDAITAYIENHFDEIEIEGETEFDYRGTDIEWEFEEYDIMDTRNSHNAELVRKINTAWKNPMYHDRFQHILLALACRDSDEVYEKFDIKISTIDDAMTNAHQIMEGVCDDLDLETILSFIGFKE